MSFKVGDKVLVIYPKGEKYIGRIVGINYGDRWPLIVKDTRHLRPDGKTVYADSRILTDESECILYDNLSKVEKLIYGI